MNREKDIEDFTFGEQLTELFFLVWHLEGVTNDSFLPNTLKTLFRLSRALLDLKKCILTGAIKLISVRSWGNLSLFEITRVSVLLDGKRNKKNFTFVRR